MAAAAALVVPWQPLPRLQPLLLPLPLRQAIPAVM